MNSQEIRDYVEDKYFFGKLHPGATILLACADTIERLTIEREIAFTLARLLTKENNELKSQS